MKLYNYLKKIYVYFYGTAAFYNVINSPCKNIVFYNNYHNGDLHYSREFIKFFKKNIPGEKYFYIHNNDKRILSDIKGVIFDIPKNILDKWKKIKLNTYKMDIVTNFVRTNDTLFMNTWIGSNQGKYLNKYNGCTLKANYNLFKTLSCELGISSLKNDMKFYIPIICFKKFEIDKINQYMKSCQTKKIFVSNGDCLSSQADNFDMSPIINELCKEYPEILFFVSNENSNIDSNIENMVYTKDIIKIEGNDLPENSYISTFCDIIIGRGSGAYCFATIQDNWFSNKKIICFSKNKDEGMWAENPNGLHSKTSNPNEAYSLISKEINSLKEVA